MLSVCRRWTGYPSQLYPDSQGESSHLKIGPLCVLTNPTTLPARAIGRQAWKHESGYYRRSLAETTMFRFKTTFGPTLRARKLENQQTEARIKCAILNRMTQLGRPHSERVN